MRRPYLKRRLCHCASSEQLGISEVICPARPGEDIGEKANCPGRIRYDAIREERWARSGSIRCGNPAIWVSPYRPDTNFET